MNVITPAIEWDFVTEPFQKESVSSIISPSNWLPRYKYFYNFDEIDTDKSGYCTLDELKAVLKQNRWNETQIESIFSTMSRANNNKISRTSFRQWREVELLSDFKCFCMRFHPLTNRMERLINSENTKLRI